MTGMNPQETSLWSSATAAEATGGISAVDWEALGVSIDSRTLQSGDLFVALSGPNFDGHDYVARALEGGASAALVARRPEGLGDTAPLLEVRDTMTGLEQLGIYGRQRTQARIVAVTGSVGKTSVKDALAHILGGQGTVSFSHGSLNNHFGVPLSLARLPEHVEYGVFELGMSHAGELTRLSQMVRPLVAIITTVEPAHLEFFDSVDDIARAKAEIFDGLEPGGTAVLNRDNTYFGLLADAARHRGAAILTFGAHADCDFRLAECALRANGSTVRVAYEGQEFSFRLNVPGRHCVENSLAIMAALSALGADLSEAAHAIAEVLQPPGRGRSHQIQTPNFDFELIDDSYNASPVSVAAALAVLSGKQGTLPGRRIAVLGDMLELGKEAAAFHRDLSGHVMENGIDLVCAAGPHMKELMSALPAEQRGVWAETADQLLPDVAALLQSGDCVLVKGSLGSRMGLIVDGLMKLGGEG